MKEFTLSSQVNTSGPPYPIYNLTIKGAPPASITIAAYGYMAELVKQAAVRLAFENEIFVELVIPTQLAPFEIGPIVSSTRQTGCLLVVEEGNLSLGWGAEIVAQVVESLGTQPLKIKRLGAKDLPIPASGPLEAQVLPSVEKIVETAIKLI